MEFNWQGYKRAIEENYTIVNKDGKEVQFILNKAQEDFFKNITGKDIILKDRQLGFSACITGIGTSKFIFGQNERCVTISNESSATQRLMDRVKYYKRSWETKNGMEIPMKYNSRSEMVFGDRNNTYYIGTAGSRDFGRGDTITFLHLSEFAFYPDPEKLLAGIMQAVVPNGLVFIETTANGFNFFKSFWDRSELRETGFKPHFYGPEWEYSKEFLEQKKKELGRYYSQEYPGTPAEAFLTSGDTYFDQEALKWYMEHTREPLSEGIIYG